MSGHREDLTRTSLRAPRTRLVRDHAQASESSLGGPPQDLHTGIEKDLEQDLHAMTLIRALREFHKIVIKGPSVAGADLTRS